jgi:CRP/FNR family transcriptional regulator, nitrogen fixation regulation protein
MSPQDAISLDRGFSAATAVAAQMPWAVPSSREDEDDNPGARNTQTLRFAADTEIYAEGDEARSYYKVTTGVVRTCRFLSDGRRQIHSFYVAGDVFGLEAGTHHRLSAEAVTDCTVVAYRRRGLEALAAQDERLVQRFFSYALQCLERAQEHSLVLGRRSATQKLAAFLLEMASKRPSDEIIDLAMTRQDIADYLGLTIETVSRTLWQLERDGVITLPAARQVRLKNRTILHELNS